MKTTCNFALGAVLFTALVGATTAHAGQTVHAQRDVGARLQARSPRMVLKTLPLGCRYKANPAKGPNPSPYPGYPYWVRTCDVDPDAPDADALRQVPTAPVQPAPSSSSWDSW